MKSTALILVAGGRGIRFGGNRPKTLADLGGRPVFLRALGAFSGAVGHVVLVAPPGLEDEFAAVAGRAQAEVQVVPGGARRQDSVAAGLQALAPAFEWILVHDAVRPLVDPDTVEAVLAAARSHGAAVPVIPIQSTVKAVDPDGAVKQTVPREHLRLVQTPQGFRRDLLERAFQSDAAREQTFTDEAALLESGGVKIMTVPGRSFNVKITTPADLAWAEAWLAAGEAGVA